MAPGLTPAEIAVAIAIVAVGSTLQAAVGFGMALVAAPLLLLIDRALVPGPLLVTSVVLTLLVAWRERAAIDLHGMSWALVGRLVSTPVAALAVAHTSERVFDAGFGGIVLLAVALSGIGLHVSPTRGHVLAAGAVSGLMGTASSIGGPPMALVYQREAGAVLRGTLAGFFVVGALCSIGALYAVGHFGARECVLGAWLAPGAVAGFAASRRIAGRLDRAGVRPLVLGLSGLAGAVALLRGLL